jgi:hypothetical protein
MSSFLPDRPRRRREGRIDECAHRDGHNSRQCLRGVEDGRAAVRTEVEDALSTVRDADVLPRDALGRHLLCVESRLHTEDASGSTLAGETVADRDPQRLALDREPELHRSYTQRVECPQADPRQVSSGDIPARWPMSAHLSSGRRVLFDLGIDIPEHSAGGGKSDAGGRTPAAPVAQSIQTPSFWTILPSSSMWPPERRSLTMSQWMADVFVPPRYSKPPPSATWTVPFIFSSK